MTKLNVVAVTQARFGSSRLPGKVLLKVGAQTLLEMHLKRIKSARRIDRLILATTTEAEDDEVAQVASRLGLTVSRGSVNDVLDRFYQAVKEIDATYVVRLTSDCPLIDPKLIDRVIDYAVSNELDYCSNTFETTYPDGQDIEVFRKESLVRAWKEATAASEREHVTPYIWKNSTYKGQPLFKSGNFSEGYAFGHLRLTVDEQRDYELIQELVRKLGDKEAWLTYAQYLTDHDSLRSINSSIGRNEGYTKSLKNDKKQ